MGVKVRERPKDSGIWWVFIDHQGKRKAKKVGKDKRLANEIAKKLEAKLVLGDVGFVSNEKQCVPTLREYVYGWERNQTFIPGWYDKVAKLSLKNSTRVGYKRILDHYLMPVFGEIRLSDIGTRQIADFVYSQVSLGLRSGTVKNIKNCLGAVLKHAHNPDCYIQSNPARGVEIPHPENEKPAREPDPLTWNEREHLEGVFERYFPKFYPLVVAGFRTGLRIGELMGLKWEDIDFYNKLIQVQRNVALGRITTPKSKSSQRQVRMTTQLAALLKDHRRRTKEEKLRKGWADLPEWVFCNEEGGLINYGNFVYRVWNKAMEKSGLRRRTPHDMRHSYATLRLSKGDSLAEVSKEMGHSNPDITYRTYYKWLPKESRSNIDELDGEVENATNRNLSATENEKGLASVS